MKKRVCIIGMGLIGGSIGMAVKKYLPDWEVIGVVRRKSAIKTCLRLKAADVLSLDLEKGLDGASIVILAMNPESMIENFLPKLRNLIQPGQIVTDVASVKEPVMRAYLKSFNRKHAYIGSHPIAGSEKKGVQYARPDLFQDRICVLTSDGNTSSSTKKMVQSFWKSLGAKTVELDSQEHDRMYAYISHMPHLASAALLSCVAKKKNHERYINLSGMGWKDMTRLAYSTPELWKEICALNSHAILKSMHDYINELKQIEKWLQRGQYQYIEKKFKAIP